MPSIRDQLRLIASQARSWAEDNRPSNWPMDLEMMCARASGMLFKRLKRAGFNPEIAFVGCHCFVICNQYIIDVTATQYNYPGYLVEWNHHVPFDRVEIIRYDTARLQKPWSGQIRFRSRELVKALDYQVDNGWPHDQLIIA